jgi:N-acetylated-alpha-linked acidic dipeptidase
LSPPKDAATLDHQLSSVERALLIPEGLPHRPWYRHSIYAPGEFTGYEAVMIPGVNEAIDIANTQRAQAQLDALTQALTRAATALSSSPQ